MIAPAGGSAPDGGHRVRGHKQALALREQYRECPVPLAGQAPLRLTGRTRLCPQPAGGLSCLAAGGAPAWRKPAQPAAGQLPSWGFNSVSARLIPAGGAAAAVPEPGVGGAGQAGGQSPGVPGEVVAQIANTLRNTVPPASLFVTLVG